MQKFRIITLAQTKHSFVDRQVAEYIKRSSRWAQLVSVPVAQKRFASLSPPKRKIAEARLLLELVPENGYLLLLDAGGRQYSSNKFASKIASLAAGGYSSLWFAIGGNFGWASEAISRANEVLSLSELTLTSELAKLVLFEQLYRALSINAGSSYHHD